jgi:mycofactocin precursor peptide peptidase
MTVDNQHPSSEPVLWFQARHRVSLPVATKDGNMIAMAELGHARWTEVGSPVLLVPLGSCEQHGPHLPMDTDSRIAVAVARGVAQTRPHVWVAPLLAYGASGEHAGFPGTLSLGTEVLAASIIELIRSAGWAAETILVNGHGGNLDGINRAVGTLRHEGRMTQVWVPSVMGGDAHAGRTETSLMLAIDPSAVRMDMAAPGALLPLSQLLPDLRAHGVRFVSANGVLGDPTGASAVEGGQLLAALIAHLGAMVDG